MVFSKWKDTQYGNDLQQLIVRAMTTQTIEKDDFDGTDLQEKKDKVFDENQVIIVSGEEVEYNYIVYSKEYIRPQHLKNPNREERVGEYIAKIIVFRYRDSLYYILDKSYSSKTLLYLRKFMGYSGQKEIIEHRFSGLKSDLFIWTVYRILQHKNVYIDNTLRMKINTLVGFKGETADGLAAIAGQGRRIMDLLTTLLFLFENKELSKVEINLSRNTERFQINLGENSVIDINTQACLVDNVVAMEEVRYCEILLKVFIEILPQYLKIFSDQIDGKIWSEKVKKKFFKDIGKEIIDEVKEISKKI